MQRNQTRTIQRSDTCFDTKGGDINSPGNAQIPLMGKGECTLQRWNTGSEEVLATLRLNPFRIQSKLTALVLGCHAYGHSWTTFGLAYDRVKT